jgi:hypothetical protein
MRSQVQVLAGPPPIVAGHSAAGSEPSWLTAGLGRAGAARPSPPARPVAPPGPPTRASGSATTTHRGRGPSRRTAATRRLQPPRAAATSRCSLHPCPPRSRPRRALRTSAWPAWSLSWSSAAAAARTHPGGPVRHRPPTGQRGFGSVARRPGLLDRRRAVDGTAATGASTRSGGHGRPASSTRSPTPPPEWEDPDASGPTGADSRRLDAGRLDTGRVDTGRVDSGRLDAGRVDRGRPSAGPSGQRSQVTGHRTAG